MSNSGSSSQGSEEFIKVYDLRKALLNLNCQDVTADDVENLTNVLAKNLLSGTIIYMNDDGASQAMITPNNATQMMQ